jgi:MipA family protein
MLSSFLLADEKISLGFGPYIQSQPYHQTDPILLPTPVIFFDYEIFYVRWSRLGVYFLGEENWGFSLTLQPRASGYKASDSTILTGMDTRYSSWEGGLSLAGKNDYGFAEMLIMNDLMHHSDGYMVRGELGTMWQHDAWSLVPSVLLIYFSQDFNNYYYGVSKHEATEHRPFYKPDGGINMAIQSYLNYDLSSHWRILANARIDRLDTTIVRSPIVSDNTIISGMISLIYNFDLH